MPKDISEMIQARIKAGKPLSPAARKDLTYKGDAHWTDYKGARTKDAAIKEARKALASGRFKKVAIRKVSPRAWGSDSKGFFPPGTRYIIMVQ